MNKRIITLFSILVFGLALVSCDDKNDVIDNLTFDKNSVELIVEGTTVVKVSGGVAPYTAVPANEEVASVEIEGTEITVTAISEGTTTVEVEDSEGTKASFTVKVEVDNSEEETE